MSGQGIKLPDIICDSHQKGLKMKIIGKGLLGLVKRGFKKGWASSSSFSFLSYVKGFLTHSRLIVAWKSTEGHGHLVCVSKIVFFIPLQVVIIWCAGNLCAAHYNYWPYWLLARLRGCFFSAAHWTAINDAYVVVDDGHSVLTVLYEITTFSWFVIDDKRQSCFSVASLALSVLLWSLVTPSGPAKQLVVAQSSPV